MPSHGDDAVGLHADADNDPTYWPREMQRCSDRAAQAREQATLLQKLEKVFLGRLAANEREQTPSISKAEAMERATLSPDYEDHIRKMASAERSWVFWRGRYEVAKAQHEAARTYEATRRRAAYG